MMSSTALSQSQLYSDIIILSLIAIVGLTKVREPRNIDLGQIITNDPPAGIYEWRGPRLVCTATRLVKVFAICPSFNKIPILCRRVAKIYTRLRGCAGWSVSSLFASVLRSLFSVEYTLKYRSLSCMFHCIQLSLSIGLICLIPKYVSVAPYYIISWITMYISAIALCLFLSCFTDFDK